MIEDEPLDISIVFKALSKPATIMGVDYDYFFISGLIVMLVFIYADNLLAFLLFFPLHLVGWILCKIDPHIFKLLSVRASVGAVKNKSLWRCQSYEAF
jgi:type IV secretion system protein VirB3